MYSGFPTLLSPDQMAHIQHVVLGLDLAPPTLQRVKEWAAHEGLMEDVESKEYAA